MMSLIRSYGVTILFGIPVHTLIGQFSGNIHSAWQIGTSSTKSVVYSKQALYGNPAGLHKASMTYGLLTSSEFRFVPGVLGASAGILLNTADHHAFGLLLSNFGNDVYDENGIHLAYSRPLSDHFSMGLKFHLYRWSVKEHFTLHRFNMSWGLLWELGDAGKLGVYLPDLVSLMSNQDISRTVIHLGHVHRFSDLLNTFTEIQVHQDTRLSIVAGFSYQPAEVLITSLSFSSLPVGPSFALGIRVSDKLHIEVGYRLHQYLGKNVGLSLGYDL